MLSFSERNKFKPIRESLQIENMDDDLRNSIWNFIYTRFLNSYSEVHIKSHILSFKFTFDEFLYVLWMQFFKYPVNYRPGSTPQALMIFQEEYDALKWYKVYDLLEFLQAKVENDKEYFEEKLNKYLESEMSGYRMINGIISPIVNEVEIQAIELALKESDDGRVKTHLNTAIELLSDKEKPDFRNSIKESFSALESMAKIICGNEKATLHDALKLLKDDLHPALKDGFTKLYAYTSDGEGIRHALKADSTLTQADAKYFLVTCSAFINYLKEKFLINIDR